MSQNEEYNDIMGYSQSEDSSLPEEPHDETDGWEPDVSVSDHSSTRQFGSQKFVKIEHDSRDECDGIHTGPESGQNTEEDGRSLKSNPRKRKRNTPKEIGQDSEAGHQTEQHARPIEEEVLHVYLEAKSRCEELRNLKSIGQIDMQRELELIELETKVAELEAQHNFHDILAADISTNNGESAETQPPKKRRPRARNAAEAHARHHAEMKARQSRLDIKRRAIGKNKRPGVTANRPKKGKEAGTIAKQSNNRLFELLRSRDVIKDSNDAKGPTIGSGVRANTKQSQMAQLLSNVPDEYTIHHKARDKKELEEAAKRFGYKS